jgi:hypothetical protein
MEPPMKKARRSDSRELLILQLKADIKILQEKLEETINSGGSPKRLPKEPHSQVRSIVVVPTKPNTLDSDKINSKLYRCITCETTFSYGSSLRRHNIRFHQGLTRTFRCETCYTEFTRKDVLIRHFNQIHKKTLYNTDFTTFTKSNDPKDTCKAPRTWIPPPEARPKSHSRNVKFKVVPGDNTPNSYTKQKIIPDYLFDNKWLPSNTPPISPLTSPQKEIKSMLELTPSEPFVMPLMDIKVDTAVIDKYTTKEGRKTAYKRSYNSDSECSIDSVSSTTSCNKSSSNTSQSSSSSDSNTSISSNSSQSSSNTSITSTNSIKSTAPIPTTPYFPKVTPNHSETTVDNDNKDYKTATAEEYQIHTSKSPVLHVTNNFDTTKCIKSINLITIDPLLEYLNNLSPPTKPFAKDFNINNIINQPTDTPKSAIPKLENISDIATIKEIPKPVITDIPKSVLTGCETTTQNPSDMENTTSVKTNNDNIKNDTTNMDSQEPKTEPEEEMTSAQRFWARMKALKSA